MRTVRQKWEGTKAAPDGPLPRWLARVLGMLMPVWLAKRIVAAKGAR